MAAGGFGIERQCGTALGQWERDSGFSILVFLGRGYVQTSDKRRAKSEDWRVNGGEEEVAHVAPIGNVDKQDPA